MLCFVTTRVRILEARSENGCGKWHFFGLKLGQDLENRAAHHHQEIPGVTPPPPPREQTICVKFIPGRLIILRRKKLLFIN